MAISAQVPNPFGNLVMRNGHGNGAGNPNHIDHCWHRWPEVTKAIYARCCICDKPRGKRNPEEV